jgi:ABC-type uncharacterized transport system ATPase subunit
MTARIAAGTRLGGPGQTGDGSGSSVAVAAASRSFGTVLTFDRLTLDIVPGDLVALLGSPGCGKATALRTMAGFEFGDSATAAAGIPRTWPVLIAGRT